MQCSSYCSSEALKPAHIRAAPVSVKPSACYLQSCRLRQPQHWQHQHQSTALQLPRQWAQALARDSSSSSSSTVQAGAEDDEESALSTSGREQQQDQHLLTFEEVQQIAAARGLHISLKTLGPAFRIVCRDGGETDAILGVTSGFVAPAFGLMHCDMLQIFTRGLKGEAGLRIRKNALGLGLLLGGAVFSYGKSCGCKKAEILAINDDDAWHERLVRYYSYFGFKPVCKVGGQGFFSDLPHLLVWGGEGTRMDADIDEALGRWSAAVRQSARSAADGPGANAGQQHSSSSSSGSSSSSSSTHSG